MKNITVDKKLPMHEFLWQLAGGKPIKFDGVVGR